MSFDLDKLQAVAELGEVIRLQNESLERLQAFKKARPYMIMPNLAKMVEENMKESVQVLYKELNNLHRPTEQQTRYICDMCKMAFLVKLPGGICDECRAKQSATPREYKVNAPPVSLYDSDEEEQQQDTPSPEAQDETAPADDSPAPEVDPSDFRAEETDISVIADSGPVPVDEQQVEEIADDVEHAATGDKLPVQEEAEITENPPVDASGADSEVITAANAAAESDEDAAEEMSEEFMKFMNAAGNEDNDRKP